MYICSGNVEKDDGGFIKQGCNGWQGNGFLDGSHEHFVFYLIFR